jgi:uncharacterized protein
MARPKCCRFISQNPGSKIFKPVGIPLSMLTEIILSLDEYEALRLADLEQLYHDEAAVRMNVSRQTFGRILQKARFKVTKVLNDNCALKIQGGEITVAPDQFRCSACFHIWSMDSQQGSICPKCGNAAAETIEIVKVGDCARRRCSSKKSLPLVQPKSKDEE